MTDITGGTRYRICEIGVCREFIVGCHCMIADFDQELVDCW